MGSETVRTALDQVWNALEPLGCPIALFGGVSLAAWNHPRATRDVDLLLGLGPERIEAVVELLRPIGCRPKKWPPLVTVGDHVFAQFLLTPPEEFYEIQIDLLFAQTDLQKSAIGRRVERSVPGLNRPISVLSCEDLILFKLQAGRMIDRADAAMLLRENREIINLPYLREWLAQEVLQREFAEIWEEAFPGEANPC